MLGQGCGESTIEWAKAFIAVDEVTSKNTSKEFGNYSQVQASSAPPLLQCQLVCPKSVLGGVSFPIKREKYLFVIFGHFTMQNQKFQKRLKKSQCIQ